MGSRFIAQVPALRLSELLLQGSGARKAEMTRAKLSRKEMVRLWRDGMTGVEIAKLAGITAQAVSYHVKKVVGGAKERSRKKVAATMKGKT
jgi:DNA-binding CsgD family transcriptional regulator